MNESQQCCVIGIYTAIVSIGISILGYACWNAVYVTIPQIRYHVFCDRMLCHRQIDHTAASEEQQCEYTDHEEDGSQLFAIHCLKTKSYSYAVTCSCHLREMYGIWCDIIRRDSSNGQSVVPWYTLVTPPMTSEVCDNIVTMLRNRGTMRYIHKTPIT